MLTPEQHSSLKKSLPLIVLTGYRATGKTAVGRILAELLGYRFLDTDEVIVDRLGCTIAESVNRNGWLLFRDHEQAVLNELTEKKNTVAATGGGAVLHRETWQQLCNRAFVIWLRADITTILFRLGTDRKTPQQRPSLMHQDLKTETAVLLAEREPLYRAGSDMVVDTDTMTPEALAAAVFQKLTVNLPAE